MLAACAFLPFFYCPLMILFNVQVPSVDDDDDAAARL